MKRASDGFTDYTYERNALPLLSHPPPSPFIVHTRCLEIYVDVRNKERERERERERESGGGEEEEERKREIRRSVKGKSLFRSDLDVTSSRLYILRCNVSLSFRSPLDTPLLYVYESYREPRPLHRRAIKLLSLPPLFNRRISFVADLHWEKDARESTSLRHADSRGCGSVPFPSIPDLRHSIAVYIRSFQGKPARAGSSPKSRGSPLYDLGYVLIFSCEDERRVSPTLQGKYTICRHRRRVPSGMPASRGLARERERERERERTRFLGWEPVDGISWSSNRS